MRSKPSGEREVRPGVAGSKNSGRPARLMGGKALSRNLKKLPGPFNHDWTEGLVVIAIDLLKDPTFCCPQVCLLCVHDQNEQVHKQA